MGLEEKQQWLNTGALTLNVLSSVLIVFVNKNLLDKSRGHNYTFATTLSGFHFLACALSIWTVQALRLSKGVRIPFADVLYFAIVANLSIASLNLSLQINTVGFYQIAKLLIIPFVCLVEFLWLRRTFTRPVLCSMLAVVLGVAIVTVTDVNVNMLGLVIASISVVTSGMQQVLCGTMQRKHKVSSHQLLANTAPVQGMMLMMVGPFVDLFVSHQWVFDYEYNVPVLTAIGLSCVVAVIVNISQFMCLGRFSAVTFQVLGHTKTVLVLVISCTFLNETMTSKKLLGMVLAVSGMVAYGFYTSPGHSHPKPIVTHVQKDISVPLMKADVLQQPESPTSRAEQGKNTVE